MSDECVGHGRAYHAARARSSCQDRCTSGHNPGPTALRLHGTAPLVTDLSLDDLERDARHAIGEMAYAYYSGGADDERLLEGNVDAWSHWQLHPHVLAGVAEVSPATTLLGTPVSSPVAIAPTAIQGLAHPEGEVATARGAAAAGALMILSSLATCPLEDVAAAAPDAAALDAGLHPAGAGAHRGAGAAGPSRTATARWS